MYKFILFYFYFSPFFWFIILIIIHFLYRPLREYLYDAYADRDNIPLALNK